MLWRPTIQTKRIGRYQYEESDKILSDINSKTINLCGITIRESASIIKRSCLSIGVETVFVQIASALNVPNVVLLGGGFFGRFAPLSNLTSVACLPLECYGCKYECLYDTIYCVKSISENVIVQALNQSLDERSDKIRLFIQDKSLWNPGIDQPKWKMSDLDKDKYQIIEIKN